MTISHAYRGFEVLQSDDGHEVPSLGMTLPTEAAAHKAIDTDIAGWLDGYDATRKELDATHSVGYADAETVKEKPNGS